MKLSIQTYTVQEAVERDLWGALTFLRELGLNYVEIGGTFGLPVSEFKRKLDGIGLQVSGIHVGLGRLETAFEGVVEESLALENRYVVLSSVGRDLYERGWETVAKTLQPYGERLRDRGLVFAYHNHAFEFALENGKPGLDVLYESSDPQAVQAQIDTYWVAYGGSDPAAYIRKLRGRVPLVHLKDGTLGGDKPVFLEPGEGELDWSNILAACEESGVEFGAIELDVCPRDPFVSARACVEFFRHAGLKD